MPVTVELNFCQRLRKVEFNCNRKTDKYKDKHEKQYETENSL